MRERGLWTRGEKAVLHDHENKKSLQESYELKPQSPAEQFYGSKDKLETANLFAREYNMNKQRKYVMK